MLKRFWPAVVLLVLGIGPERGVGGDPDNVSLQRVLEKEAKGEVVDRVVELMNLRESVPLDAVRWQSGQLRNKNQWIAVEAIGKEAGEDDPKLDRYRKERGKSPLNLEGHLRMARWCSEHKLQEQEVAHWHGVLGFAPDHPLARERLGDTFVDGRWFSKQEVEFAREQSRELKENFKVWMPKCRDIVNKMTDANVALRRKGLVMLESIDSPDAIASLELVAMQLDDTTSLPFVNKICQFHSPQACLALVRLALLDLNTERGRIAVEGIRNYPFDLYLPDLLSLIKTEDVVSTTYYAQPNGLLVSRTLLFRESKDAKQVQDLSKVLAVRTSGQSSRAVAGNRNMSLRPFHMVHPLALTTVMKQATHDQTRTEDAIRNGNRLREEESIPVYQLLSQTTRAKVEPKAAAWWNWWNNEYSYTIPADKKVYHVSEIEYKPVLIDSPTYRVNVETTDWLSMPLGNSRRRCECLVPGTLIQTEFGLKVIEEIQIGDRVVSQDVESGELALKPVLQTTLRAPEGTRKIITALDEVEATNGHAWWVSGYGWLRTKQLQIGMKLHTSTGVAEIQSIEENPTPVVTHNLIVDEFHTYFVGKGRMLSYDNTEIKGTLKTVPGIQLTQSKND